jgi:hypothetical protein
MRITEYQIWAFFMGVAAGSILTIQLTRGEWLISRVERLSTKIHNRIETLAMFCDLTDGQRKQLIGTLIGPPIRLVSIDELFNYYRWASELKLDPIAGSALAIICEKCLGLTRWDALHAMREAKLADDYKTLLPSKNRARLETH